MPKSRRKQRVLAAYKAASPAEKSRRDAMRQKGFRRLYRQIIQKETGSKAG